MKRLASTAVICAVWVLTCAASVLCAQQATDIGGRLEMFVDGRLVDHMSNVRLLMHSPVPREIAFTPDAAWEGGNSAYFTIFRDGDKYRMYYRGCGPNENDWEFTCLAESTDGVTFTRPDLEVYEFNGSKHNNIVYKGRGNNFWEAHNFTPFKDTNPACKPEERYKAVALTIITQPKRARALAAFTSPDGIHWKQIGDGPVFTDGSFDSQNVPFWDSNTRQYVLYFRPNAPLRTVGRATSPDFVHWTNTGLLDFGSSPREQFYTNAITQYCRDPYWYVGLPMRFVNPPASEQTGGKKLEALSDAVLITSRDGVAFDRTFTEAFIRPGPNPNNWTNPHGNQTPACGIVQTSPEELSVYWSENYPKPRIRRGVLRVDGFASVNAPYAGGEFVTKPIVFSGKRLVINYATSAVGSVSVEIQHADGSPISGFGLSKCAPIWGDEIERVVAWDGKADLSSLAGEAVRLRFVMKDADLYSYRFE